MGSKHNFSLISNMRLNFGKYKNKELGGLPVDYVMWLAQYDVVGGRIETCEPATKAAEYVQNKKSFYINAARRELKARRICFACGRVMPAVGSSRKNGKRHRDWGGRTLHKKCWKLSRELEVKCVVIDSLL